jgi:hypothetical protein
MFGQSSDSLKEKEEAHRLNSLSIRTQPLYLVTHNTLMFEADYSFNEKTGLGLDYYYSFQVPEGDDICFRCVMTEFAETRHLIGLSFRVNLLEKNGLGLYVAPYGRYRVWKGSLDNYSNVITYNNNFNPKIQSNGLSLGGIVGFKESFGKRLDYNFFMGYGRYILESYDLPEGYSLEFDILNDWRLGLTIGVKIF